MNSPHDCRRCKYYRVGRTYHTCKRKGPDGQASAIDPTSEYKECRAYSPDSRDLDYILGLLHLE